MGKITIWAVLAVFFLLSGIMALTGKICIPHKWLKIEGEATSKQRIFAVFACIICLIVVVACEKAGPWIAQKNEQPAVQATSPRNEQPAAPTDCPPAPDQTKSDKSTNSTEETKSAPSKVQYPTIGFTGRISNERGEVTILLKVPDSEINNTMNNFKMVFLVKKNGDTGDNWRYQFESPIVVSGQCTGIVDTKTYGKQYRAAVVIAEKQVRFDQEKTYALKDLFVVGQW